MMVMSQIESVSSNTTKQCKFNFYRGAKKFMLSFVAWNIYFFFVYFKTFLEYNEQFYCPLLIIIWLHARRKI